MAAKVTKDKVKQARRTVSQLEVGTSSQSISFIPKTEAQLVWLDKQGCPAQSE